MAERNIDVFSADAERLGGYAYTQERWSAKAANGRCSKELHAMLRDHFRGPLFITDIGCGDGTYTREFVEALHPISIRGVDPAAGAIVAAQRNNSDPSISYRLGSIYTVENAFRDSEAVSVAVLRGVLHHLDQPLLAIKRLVEEFDHVVALEPNGYNLGLKLIEKLSPYHRAHDEKSYWPPTLNRWFRECGFTVVDQRFFCFVPFFCPTVAARVMKLIEPAVEAIPGVRCLAGATNLILYRKS
jgi:SAM-dependent methyltransferase